MTGQSAALCQRLHRLAGEQVLRELPDQELVGRFAGQRDESAFAALVRRHGPMVLGVCRRVLHDGHAAEDAFQATFLVLARRAGELRRGEAVSGWLYGVAYRVARKARTAAARRCAREQAAPPRPGGADPAEEISLREARAIFDEELARLPQRYQAPLVLCCLEGLARDEAAARLGWPPGTLKSRLQSARRLLHARLTRRGLTLSAGLFTTLAAEGARAALPAALLRGAGDAARAATASGAAAVPVPAKVAALADGVLRTTFPARWKIALALVLAGGTGTGVILAHTQGQKPDDDDRPAAAARGEEAPGRTDRFGDPLPQGAVARLGTERFRHEDMI
ncbi:MAG TPA: sigma-70 family RNA polymerase sigma factor, partial [Gemmataceae bacterium]